MLWMRRSVILGSCAALALPVASTGCKSSPPTVSMTIDACCASSSKPDAGASRSDGSTSRPDATSSRRDAASPCESSCVEVYDANIPDVHRGEPPAPPSTDFCNLAGSVVWSGGSMQVVPGGPSGTPI